MSFLERRIRDARRDPRDPLGRLGRPGSWLLHGASHELQKEPHGDGNARTGLEASQEGPAGPTQPPYAGW